MMCFTLDLSSSESPPLASKTYTTTLALLCKGNVFCSLISCYGLYNTILNALRVKAGVGGQVQLLDVLQFIMGWLGTSGLR